MAKSDILIRWKADTANYDANMAKAKRQLEQFGQQNMTAGKAIQQLTSNLSGMIAKFAGFGAIAAGVGKLTSEIRECVKQGIELAKQAEGIRNAFDRLGRGDILDGLRQATHNTVTDVELMKAAVKFDDFKLPVEELGTMLAFAQQKAKDTGQSVDYMVDSIVTGLGRKSLMILDNLGLSANEVKEKMKETGDMTKAVGAIIRQQMESAGDYVETAADRAAQADTELKNAMEELGRTFQPLSDSASSMWTEIKVGALDLLNNAVKPLINELTEAGRLRKEFDTLNGGGTGGQTRLGHMLGMLRHYSGDKQGLYNRQLSRFSQLEAQAWGEANSARQRYTSLSQKGGNAQVQRQLYDQWQDAERRAKAWNQMSQKYQAGAKGILNPTTATATVDDGKKNKKSGKNTPDPVVGSIDAQAKKVADLQKAWRAAADDDSRLKIKKEIEEAEFALEILEGKSSGIPTMNYGLGDLAGKGGSGLFQDPGFKVDSSPKVTWKLDSKAMDALGKEIERINTKSEVKLNEKVADITSGVSQVVGGIEALGIEVPEGMKNVLGGIQAVCTILTGISAIITAIQAIVAADAIIPFARGGVVHAANGYVTGNHYSGDLVPAMLNSGELVLNRAQQGNLASQLNDARGGAQLEAVITGEQLRLVLNNNGRRTGRGEVLTTKFY